MASKCIGEILELHKDCGNVLCRIYTFMIIPLDNEPEWRNCPQFVRIDLEECGEISSIHTLGNPKPVKCSPVNHRTSIDLLCRSLQGFPWQYRSEQEAEPYQQKMDSYSHLLILGIYCMTTFSAVICLHERSYTIDYENNTFVKDGKPFRYIAGSIHYSRVPQYYWRDRLEKIHAAGLDAVEVYVPWNIHEPEQGIHDFSGRYNLTGFIQLAQDVGLLVILRAGPYTDASWDYGGFPYWIKIHNESTVLRSMDPGYILPVTRWFNVLLPLIKPLLYHNGGPIIMIQVENEYGSYRSVDCGHDYMRYLRDLFRQLLGQQIVLFTTDGPGKSFLQCGSIEGLYPTIDFGPGKGNAKKYFAASRQWNPKGPLVNSEYYPGWHDYWEEPWKYGNTASIIRTLREMLDMGASVSMPRNFMNILVPWPNMSASDFYPKNTFCAQQFFVRWSRPAEGYMFHGGTNFGLINGADYIGHYKPVTTSYDYNAPITEAGDITAKYMAIRNLLKKYKSVPSNIPNDTTKADYGTITMHKTLVISDNLKKLSAPPIKSKYPISMEKLGQAFGFAAYQTELKSDIPLSELDLSGVRDRAYIMLDGVSKGKVYRNSKMKLNLSGNKGQLLLILVENMGRIIYGPEINHNRKGLIANVTWNGAALTDWYYYNIDLHKGITPATEVTYRQRSKVVNDVDNHVPAFYSGTFKLNENQKPQDTFFSMCGWTKGVVIMNNFTVGRYWPTVGPQVTLYVPPHTILPHPFTNTLTMLELEGAPCNHSNTKLPDNHQQMLSNNMISGSNMENSGCTVKLVDKPRLGSKCSSIDE